MIELEWLWALYLIPLPFLVYLLFPPALSENQAALRVPFYAEFDDVQSVSKKLTSNSWVLWSAVLAWVLFSFALSRPQWLGDAVELPVSGRDLMLAVDLSGSMEVKDFKLNGNVVDRLTATKFVASDFIDDRVGDRLGLILFGRQAYLQTPLTFDRETVKILLQESVIGLAGKETAIGDAIGLAVKRLKESKEQQRQKDEKPNQVLILLTDGANTAGKVDPLKAAELAAAEGLKIYTIGIGADEMLVRSLFGSRKVNPSADLDEEALQAIAKTTSGKYFRARDLRGLEIIYDLLDKLEPIVKESQSFRPKTSLYVWPLSFALLIACFVLIRQSK